MHFQIRMSRECDVNYLMLCLESLVYYQIRRNFSLGSRGFGFFFFFIMAPCSCVIQGCDNFADLENGISMHKSPSLSQKLLRGKWINFVRTRRKNFIPVREFGICSIHFTRDCFGKAFYSPGEIKWLVPGAVPNIWKLERSNQGCEDATTSTSRRAACMRKRVSRVVFHMSIAL